MQESKRCEFNQGNPLQYPCLENESPWTVSLVGYSLWGGKESDKTTASLPFKFTICSPSPTTCVETQVLPSAFFILASGRVLVVDCKIFSFSVWDLVS